MEDALDIQRLAGDFEVAKTTLNVPHPYEDGMAEEWIESQKEDYQNGHGANFAITLAADGALCGSIGLVISKRHNHGELGYWMGVPYWGQGYGTEAAWAVCDYGFNTLKLHRIHAYHITRNPASGRIMQKIGMQYEGKQREHIRKWNRYDDIEMYGLLASDWKKANPERK